MNEVSCRASAVLLETADQWGLDVTRLVGGLPVAEAVLRDPSRRIDWQVYVDFLEHLQRECGGSDEQLIQLAEASLSTAVLRRTARLMAAVGQARQLYWLAARWAAPAFFPHVRHTFEADRSGVLRIEAELPPAYRGCTAFFHVGTGVFRGLPRLLGHTEAARIDASVDTHRATYCISPPTARPWRVRLRQLFMPRAATKALLRELVDQQREVQRSYRQLAAAHRQLQQHTDEFQQLMDNMQDMLSILDAEGRIRYASPSHLRILGYSVEELLGQPVLDFVHPDDRAAVADTLTRTIERGQQARPLELRFRHRDGNWRTLECVGSSIQRDGQPAGIVSSRDITERKRAEQRTEMLLDVARNISASLDLQTVLDGVQSRVAAVVGCERVATYCFDPERGGFYLAAQHGLPSEILEHMQGKVYPPGQPFGGKVLDGETIVCNDLRAQDWLPASLCEQLGIATYVAAPLRVRRRHLGLVIATNSRDDQPFAPDQVQLLEGIARQLGVAIEAAGLLRSQQAEAELSTALARVSREMIAASSGPDALTELCRLTNEVLHCDYSHTWLWDEEHRTFAPVAGAGDSPEDWESMRVLRIGSPFAESLAEQLQHHDILSSGDSNLAMLTNLQQPQTLQPVLSLIVALRRGSDVFGFHSAGFRSHGKHFSQLEERLAHGIGQIAGLVIDHVRVVQALEQANLLKSEFVATMSHELRTPLNVIIGYTDLLRDRVFGELSEEQADALERVDTRARELFDLITATLDLSRLESGRVAVHVAPLSVGELVGELDSETREVRSKPGLDFRWEVAESLPIVHTDRLKLKVVLKNLIGNALKFTDSGHVTVAVHPDTTGVRFTVQDSGIGIAEDILPVIFEPFRQGHTGLAREYGGVGLGLYIVRRLLDMLGGTVHVDSTAGRGTTFQVWLPSLEAGLPTPANLSASATGLPSAAS